MNQQQKSFEDFTRTLQIIIFALIAGVVMFLGVTLVNKDKNAQPVVQPLISYVAIFVTMMALVTRIIVKQILVKGARSNLLRQDDIKEESYGEL